MDRFFRGAHAGEHPSITSRRAFEDGRLTLDAQQSLSLKLLEHAEWERRSNGLVRQNKVKRIVNDQRKADEAALTERRRRLRALVQAEEAALQSELSELTETAEARKERVVAEARRLKAAREVAREAAAADGYAQQWKERCDDLRTIDSTFFALHCHEVVEGQMADKERRTRERRAEEQREAEEAERLRVEAVKREEAAAARRKEATKDNRRALQQQVDRHVELRRQQREREETEKEITVRARPPPHPLSSPAIRHSPLAPLTRPVCPVSAPHPSVGRCRGEAEG